MEKRLCTAVALLLAGVAGAQTQKGNGLISGDVSIDYSRSNFQQNETTQRGWEPVLNLTAGRFVADNWLLGIAVSSQSTFRKSETSVLINQLQGTLSQRDASIAVITTPFVRRYWQFAPVQVFAGAGLSVGVNGNRLTDREFDELTQQIIPVEQRNRGLRISPHLEAGANYFLTNRLALQLSISAASLPLSVGSVSTGLVYWTGANRKNKLQPTRKNVQTKRDNWLVEGGFHAGRASTDFPSGNTEKSAGYSISPSVGYFISERNVLGISVPVGFGSYENSSPIPPNSSANWSVGISPYFQHYWISTRLTPYTRASTTYSTLEYKTDSGINKRNSLSAEGSIGLAYMAGQRLIIETSLANASLTYRPSNDSETDAKLWDARLSGGLRGNFAIRYALTRPK